MDYIGAFSLLFLSCSFSKDVFSCVVYIIHFIEIWPEGYIYIYIERERERERWQKKSAHGVIKQSKKSYAYTLQITINISLMYIKHLNKVRARQDTVNTFHVHLLWLCHRSLQNCGLEWNGSIYVSKQVHLSQNGSSHQCPTMPTICMSQSNMELQLKVYPLKGKATTLELYHHSYISPNCSVFSWMNVHDCKNRSAQFSTLTCNQNGRWNDLGHQLSKEDNTFRMWNYSFLSHRQTLPWPWY